MIFHFDEDLVLEDARALLRPMVREDVERLLEVAVQEKDLLRYSPAPIHDRALLEAYVEKAVERRRNKERYTFTVFDKASGAWAGSTSYLNIAPGDDRLEVGATWYGKAFQRTGLNRHCKYLLLRHAFDTLGAERVELRTDERNAASRAAIEAIGASREGLLKHHMRMPDGHRRNTVCYAILRADWEEMKDRFLERKAVCGPATPPV